MDVADNHLYYSGMLDLLVDADLTVQSGAHGVLSPDWRWDNPGHSGWRGFALWAVVEGSAILEEGGDRRPVARGDVFVMRMDVPRRGRHDPRNPLVVPWCVFDYRGAADDGWPGTWRARMGDVDFAAGLIRRAVDASQGGDPALASNWIHSFFLEISHNPGDVSETGSVGWAARLDRIADTMRRHPERRFPIPRLAWACRCDPDHLARLFRRRFGVPPGRFAIRCRIDRARSLLQFTDLGIEAIADRLGYTDPYFFSRQFKGITGHSPTAYRSSTAGR